MSDSSGEGSTGDAKLIALLYGGAGLGLYLVVHFLDISYPFGPGQIHLGGVGTAIAILFAAGAPSFIASVIGLFLGAANPRVASYLLQPWFVVMLCVGAVAGAIGLELLRQLVVPNQPETDPTLKVALTAGATIVTGVVGIIVGRTGAWDPGWLAKALIQSRYRKYWPAEPTPDVDQRAYRAIERDGTGLGGRTLTGWGRKDAETRFEAIRAGLQSIKAKQRGSQPTQA